MIMNLESEFALALALALPCRTAYQVSLATSMPTRYRPRQGSVPVMSSSIVLVMAHPSSMPSPSQIHLCRVLSIIYSACFTYSSNMQSCPCQPNRDHCKRTLLTGQTKVVTGSIPV